MESVLNEPYYSYCTSLLFAAPSSTLEDQNNAFLPQHALDIYNLRPRNIQAVMPKQEASQNLTTITNTKRERVKPVSRSRMLYNKRLLVNARERERMKTLNKGFENLRNALPCYIADGHISKITTLRLAINYIKTLSDVLKDTNSEDSEKHPKDTLNPVQDLKVEPLIYGAHGRIEVEYASSFSLASTSLPNEIKPHLTSPENESSATIATDRAFPALFENNNFLKPTNTEL